MKMNALLSTFDNVPSLLENGSKHRFEASLEQATVMLGKIEAATDKPVMADDFWFSADDWRSAYRPYTVKDGILLIPVKGVLLHDFGYQLGSWATGYTYIAQALRRGLADDQVKGIAFIVDSPGGHVSGNFELVDEIYEARGRKPMRAFVESGYSAAYSITSGVDPKGVYVTRAGGAGSIGVLTAHLDVSGAMEQDGYVITFIFAGKHKVDGNPYEALPKDVKARTQARIDELMTLFVSTVARNRAMDEQVIRDFEALTFTAIEAKANGLADEIGSLDEAIAVFTADINDIGDEEMAMTEDEKKTAAQAVESAKAEGVIAGKAEGITEGTKIGAKAEKDRINAIMDSDEGKKRPIAARAAAFDTDMTADAATAFLAKLPEEKAAAVVATPVDPKAAGAAAFNAAMAVANPELGAPDAGGDNAEAPSRADRAFALSGKAKKAA